MFLGSKVRLVRGTDNLIAMCEPIVQRCGILNISQPYRPLRPVMGLALLCLPYFINGEINCANSFIDKFVIFLYMILNYYQ
jgi:hypothetical protein